MTRIQELEEVIKALTPEELVEFRKWFQSYDSSQWDNRIEEDALSGKLDQLAAKALSEHRAGRSTEI